MSMAMGGCRAVLPSAPPIVQPVAWRWLRAACAATVASSIITKQLLIMRNLFNHTRASLAALFVLAFSAAATVLITRHGNLLAGVYFG